MDGWNTSFLLERPIFRGYVSFMECIFSILYQHLLAFLHRHLWLNAGRATGLTGQVTSNGGLPRFTEREVGSAEQLMLSRMPEGCSWLQWRIYFSLADTLVMVLYGAQTTGGERALFP